MQLKYIFKGIRPKTLVAAFVPPISAYALANHLGESGPVVYLILCLGLAFSIQIATNFYNDAIDFLKGADDNRVGPARITTQHQVNVKKVFFTGHLFILIALLCGIPLMIKGGPVIGVLGLVSLFLTYGYTGGPYPLAYLGLGELFVFLFFGLAATMGSYFIFTDRVDLLSLVVGSQLGLLSTVLIAINNYRDRKTDKLINKNTLATKMSNQKYLLLIDIFLFVPYLLVIFLSVKLSFLFLINFVSILLAFKIRKELRGGAEAEELNKLLAMSGAHLLMFSLIFCGVSLWP